MQESLLKKIKSYNKYKKLSIFEQIKWVEKNFKIGGVYTFDEKFCIEYLGLSKIFLINLFDKDFYFIVSDKKINFIYLGMIKSTQYPYECLLLYYNNNKYKTSIIHAFDFKFIET